MEVDEIPIIENGIANISLVNGVADGSQHIHNVASSSVDMLNPQPSSSQRPACRYGTQCYRQNPSHREEMTHPGDVDYQVPSMPDPDDGVPKCRYGKKCYRLNPEHFRNFAHPRNTNLQENYRRHYLHMNAAHSSDEEESELSDFIDDEEPFSNDEDSDYRPSDDE